MHRVKTVLLLIVVFLAPIFAMMPAKIAAANSNSCSQFLSSSRALTPQIKDNLVANAKSDRAPRILLDAIAKNDITSVCVLLMSGVDPNSVVDEEVSALGMAAARTHSHLVQVLLEFGANPNLLPTNSIYTPLLVTAYNGDVQTAELLLDHGADTSLKGSQGDLAVCTAAQRNNYEFLKLLYSVGADLNMRGRHGMTPFHCAALVGAEETIGFLISQSVNMDVFDDFDRTPLMYLVIGERMDLAMKLIDCGADIQASSRSGKTALNFVNRTKFPETADYMSTASGSADSYKSRCPY